MERTSNDYQISSDTNSELELVIDEETNTKSDELTINKNQTSVLPKSENYFMKLTEKLSFPRPFFP